MENNTTTSDLGLASNETQTWKENPWILAWYLQVIYIIIFVVTVVISAGGNIIVIWIVVAHRRMRTVTNYFLVNLAVADALISILNTLFNFVYMLHNHWPFGKHYCKFTQFIAPCTISASVFTFMAIAVDRWVSICNFKVSYILCSKLHGYLLKVAVGWDIGYIMGLPARVEQCRDELGVHSTYAKSYLNQKYPQRLARGCKLWTR